VTRTWSASPSGCRHRVGTAPPVPWSPAASAIEEVSPRATEDLHELWRRIASTILISNTDDHLRNHAFLHAGGNAWSLSPASDLNPDRSEGRKHLATAIDEADTTASIETLMSVAPYFRLDEEDGVDVLREVLVATSRWRQVAAKHGISKVEIEQMVPAFEHAEREAARDLTGA
jgi:serine/threonine-protein kinase HipA